MRSWQSAPEGVRGIRARASAPPCPFLHLIKSRTVHLAPQDHGSPPRKDLTWLRLGAGSGRHPAVCVTPRIPQCSPNQPQHKFSHQFFGSNSYTPNWPPYELPHDSFRSDANLFCPILAVFKLPDELIICILSQVSPDPQLTRHYPCFCIPYKRICNFHGQRAQSLRPLSMTCRAMRLRFLSWIWEYIALSWQGSEETFVSNLNTIANASHADKSVAASVKYFHVFLFPCLGLIRAP